MSWFTRNKGNECNTLAAAWDEWNQSAHTVTVAGYAYLIDDPAQGANLDTVRATTKALRVDYNRARMCEPEVRRG
jgi:hypothetical protein